MAAKIEFIGKRKNIPFFVDKKPPSYSPREGGGYIERGLEFVLCQWENRYVALPHLQIASCLFALYYAIAMPPFWEAFFRSKSLRYTLRKRMLFGVTSTYSSS